MALSPGIRLGPYEIVSALGAGGMGEVYKARDTRLDRTVAIKILPESLGADPQFRDRFDREARAISQLTHPHICTLYDVGEAPNPESHVLNPLPLRYLVMEFLDGDTLLDRLKNGALSLDQALPIAIQIADALAAAHRSGIVHRDLKPGNVMLTKTGAKLLDFGLAKTAVVTGTAPGAVTAMPTTPAAMTAQGTIVGTFQYMAPEQIEGHDADARTDLFAFGCVLYEMLTGAKAFAGKTHASLIGAIMHAEPAPLAAIAPLASPALDRTVHRCLAKEPDARWQSAADVADELRWIAETGGAPAAPIRTAHRRLALPWMVAALPTVAALAIAVWAWRRPVVERPAPTMRFTIQMPAGWSLGSGLVPLALSPDGNRFAFQAVQNTGPSQIWLRSFDAIESRPLPHTDGGGLPFWSPNGQELGFYVASAQELRRITIGSEESRLICAAATPLGASWSTDGTIVYGSTAGLWRVAADGGGPAPLTTATPEDGAHSRPWFLPDGRHYLYNSFAIGLMAGSLDGPGRRDVAPGGHGMFSVVDNELWFLRGQTLVRQPLDAGASRVIGEPKVVLPRVEKFSVTPSVLVYLPNQEGGTDELLWFDRSGKPLGSLGERGDFSNVELSPDASRVAVATLDPRTGLRDIWTYDSTRGVPQRLTFGPGEKRTAIWSPDGKTILYNRRLARTGTGSNIAIDFFLRAADGSGNETPVLVDGISKDPLSWAPDGRYVLYRASGLKTINDLYALPMSGAGKPVPIAVTSSDEQDGRIAPDGRWVAYSSDDSGQMEVYVAQFPSAGSRVRISAAGGTHPRWQRDGRALFYLANDNRLMAVDVTLSAGDVRVADTRALFALHTPTQAGFLYDVTPDGQRFLVITDVGAQPPLTVVTNWHAAK